MTSIQIVGTTLKIELILLESGSAMIHCEDEDAVVNASLYGQKTPLRYRLGLTKSFSGDFKRFDTTVECVHSQPASSTVLIKGLT